MENKVTIKLLGGLGNNLFQIACAYSYALKHKKELVLVNEKFGATHNSLDSYKGSFLSNVDFVSGLNTSGFNSYNEPGFNYNEIPSIEGDVFIQGYYQSEKYFKEHSKEVKELFSCPKEFIDDIKSKYKDLLSKNTCSIHVRRGDYLNSPDHHPVVGLNYFMKAMKKFPKDCIFLVFSDDVKWCKENFPAIGEKFFIIESGNDIEDFALMTMCDHNCIANSSFSWWAAWLNDNPDKIVVAPNRWFGSAYSDWNTNDLYCDGWIKI